MSLQYRKRRLSDSSTGGYARQIKKARADAAMRAPYQYPRGMGAAQPYRLGYSSVARARGASVTGESKYFDSERDGGAVAACTTTWVAGTSVDPTRTINLGSASVATPLCLFAPTVGAGLNQRIGKSCYVYKIKIRGAIYNAVQAAQSAADSNCVVRIMLVMDKQTNSAQMTGAQLMQDTGTALNTTLGLQNSNNFGRFKVLKEKQIIIDNLGFTGSPTAGDVIQNAKLRTFKMNYTFRVPVSVRFNATNGGTVADIVDNSFHMICGASGVANVPVLSYYCRVCFKEN